MRNERMKNLLKNGYVVFLLLAISVTEQEQNPN